MRELDDPEVLKSIDRSGMLGLITDYPDLLLEGLNYGWAIEPRELGKTPSKVVLVGYGGSAIPGDILRNRFWGKAEVPIEVCRDLALPAYVDEETLIVCTSYSGETEETLKLLVESSRAGLNVAALTAGEMMAVICDRFQIPMIRVRGGFPPRAALPLLLSALATVLSSYNVVADMRNEINQTAEELRAQASRLGPSTDSELNPCKKLALELLDAMPAVYSLERMSSVARRLKDQFNENSKIAAKYDLVPEACHNEVEGWSRDWLMNMSPLRFAGIFIRDSKESLDESSRMDLLKERLELAGLKTHAIRAEANTDLGRLLLPLNFGDFVSVYLALARGVDPAPLAAIEEIKRKVETRTREKERLRRLLSG